MNPYQYVISLRLRHPTIDLSAASERLSLVPKRMWVVGSPRTTPTGSPLDGTYRESYWCADVLGGAKFDSSDRPVDEALALIHAQLSSHRAFLAELRREGGSAECFVGLFASNQFGFELPVELMGDLAALGVRIAVDAYP